jgi:hypothetical protein
MRTNPSYLALTLGSLKLKKKINKIDVQMCGFQMCR